jgi:hypothetical protein
VEYNIGKEIALLRHTNKEASNDDMTVEEEEGPLRVLNEKDFFDLMMYQRSGSSIWRKIVYFQSVVKCRCGIPETFIINFVSHLHSGEEAVDRVMEAGL